MRLADLARLIGGEVLGDGNVEVTGIAESHAAGASDLVLVTSRRVLADAEASGAAALLVGPDVERPARSAVRVRNPRLAFALVLEHLLPDRPAAWEIHPTSVLGARVRLGSPVALGPCVVVEDDVVIGDRVVIGAGTFVGRGSVIGDEARIYPNVTVREETEIGRRVILHPGVVIGAAGFGYARREDGRYHKIPHRGRVVLEDDVEIGANATVDRATLGETRIGRGTK
ncbi:MAG: UDP-3-O-(3-hydroxymyristoyl)glucosamine N-acyltransferase, partial [Armatimonadetes bacterium]|nr:UDP-3-O-(3-hydroxymyristoyl)glucosamine N-acyltransferase [Armatimonadota bacterium]